MVSRYLCIMPVSLLWYLGILRSLIADASRYAQEVADLIDGMDVTALFRSELCFNMLLFTNMVRVRLPISYLLLC